MSSTTTTNKREREEEEREEEEEDLPHNLTVGELKKLLEKFPDDLKLITSMDDEGNGYNAVYTGLTVAYIKEKYSDDFRWDGDMVLQEDDRQMESLSAEDLADNYQKVLLIN